MAAVPPAPILRQNYQADKVAISPKDLAANNLALAAVSQYGAGYAIIAILFSAKS
jgi:hypothetical protein